MEIIDDKKDLNRSYGLGYNCCCSKIVQAFLLISLALTACLLPFLLNRIFPNTNSIINDTLSTTVIGSTTTAAKRCKIPTVPINNRSEPCPVYNGYPTESVSGYKTPAIMNLALGQRVYAVSLDANYKLCNLVDGNKNSENTKCDCCISTNRDVGVSKWMIVDLANVYRIDKVVVTSAHGRTNSVIKLYIGLLMSYIDGSPITRGNYPLCGQVIETSYTGDTYSVNCKYANKGRFVILQGIDAFELMLCEVEVFGSLSNCSDIYSDLYCSIGFLEDIYCNVRYTGKTFPDQLDFNCNIAAGYPENFKNPVPVNLALGRNVMTSSLESQSFLSGINKACNAVDGSAFGTYLMGSCVSTNLINGTEWVMVDLQNNYDISEIILSNRFDGKDGNLDNVQVRIFLNYNIGQTITNTTGLFCGQSGVTPSNYIAKVNITCAPSSVTGRYVAVIRDAGISFCEIEVYGKANY